MTNYLLQNTAVTQTMQTLPQTEQLDVLRRIAETQQRQATSDYGRGLADGIAYAVKLLGGYPSNEPCEYCGPGKLSGLPGNACENCMNTGLKYPKI